MIKTRTPHALLLRAPVVFAHPWDSVTDFSGLYKTKFTARCGKKLIFLQLSIAGRSWFNKNGKLIDKKHWIILCFHVLTTRLDLQKNAKKFPPFPGRSVVFVEAGTCWTFRNWFFGYPLAEQFRLGFSRRYAKGIGRSRHLWGFSRAPEALGQCLASPRASDFSKDVF